VLVCTVLGILHFIRLSPCKHKVHIFLSSFILHGEKISSYCYDARSMGSDLVSYLCLPYFMIAGTAF